MPIFEYQCQNCGHILEVLTQASEAVPEKCPKCGESKLERKYSTFSNGSHKPDSCLPRTG